MLEIFADRAEDGMGVDLSREMLTVARSKMSEAGLANRLVRQADATALPLETGSADLITVHQVLHYIAQPERALAEWARVLAPGGLLLLADFEAHDFEDFRVEYHHVETYVREDALRLFGFLSEADRAWFVRLQAVQGVGARHALALLDAVSATGIETAAALGDASAFERAKGVGRKLAERIAMELKGKAPPARRRSQKGETLAEALADADGEAGTAPAAQPEADDDSARDVAISALINLGYGESEARHAVDRSLLGAEP